MKKMNEEMKKQNEDLQEQYRKKNDEMQSQMMNIDGSNGNSKLHVDRHDETERPT